MRRKKKKTWSKMIRVRPETVQAMAKFVQAWDARHEVSEGDLPLVAQPAHEQLRVALEIALRFSQHE